MDPRIFDHLTRSVLAEGGTRRALLRLLAGGALSGFAGCMGLSELTENAGAKTKSTRKRHKPGEKSQSAGGLQTESKRNKRRKNRPKRPPKPSRPKQCTDMFCDNGGRCCDGACVAPGLCCPGEKECGGCIAETTCCPHYERTCPDGSCIALDACCFPDEMRCPDDSCASVFECCPGEKECDGSCIAEDACCDLDPVPLCDGCHKVACEDGTYVCETILEGVDCGSGYCCPTEPPFFCSEVPGHGRMCCRPGYGGGAFQCF
jgi:hypothetical protein